ncbi:unnamed protein product [Darwinula stevensoni]|uniref:DNA ligase n=1 Tax=Darwinula stevensoni TaxID=69355 RepID=A0A7R9FN14_9CRUS|nr:unnamed protein product [Darwinula stevensoni]CAG0896318.1 unnamed protein product [Darwinula stevensoni]
MMISEVSVEAMILYTTFSQRSYSLSSVTCFVVQACALNMAVTTSTLCCDELGRSPTEVLSLSTVSDIFHIDGFGDHLMRQFIQKYRVGDFGRSHWIGLALVRQSSTLPEAYKAVAPSDDYARIQEDPERDLKNFPRPVQASEPPKVRLGFLPDDWFQFFYKKTGVTGPYLFGTGLITFLCSKEIYVMEHEYYTGLSLAFIVIYAVKKFGPQMKAWIKKESEGQKYLFDAKRENITLQLESAFRQRQLEVFNEPEQEALCLPYSIMSEGEGEERDKKGFVVEYAKRGQAGCKKCKGKLEKGSLRLGKVVPNPFSDSGGDMKQWYHLDCLMEVFSRQRASTKKIENLEEDLEGWQEINKEDQAKIQKALQAMEGNRPAGGTPKKKQKQTTILNALSPKKIPTATNSKEGFQGDLCLWVKMLLPGVQKRIYNLKGKQLIKLFSQIFAYDEEEMLEHLEQGDIAETIRVAFERSGIEKPAGKSELSMQDIDQFLTDLSQETREEAQKRILHKIVNRCTENDLKMVVRLIVHDLRITAGPKHVLDALHPKAYEAFQASHDLEAVVNKILTPQAGSSNDQIASLKKDLSVKASTMTPVHPMLAEACKSVAQAFKRCPNGMYAEIKYDGERVQVHKKGHDFKYFSRSLKPVLPHKVNHFEDFIPKAFPHGNDLILDRVACNTNSNTIFQHYVTPQKAAFQDSTVCLFVFDCIHLNGENLMGKPLEMRKQILEKNMTVIPNHIMLSEMKFVTNHEELQTMIMKVLKQGLEGLVLKDPQGVYEPGKRRWMKMKKDYLEEGAMADTADLVVLGGLMSIFLMGTYDSKAKNWKTVTKVHTGIDDQTLAKLQKELSPLMKKISRDPTRVPSWVELNRQMVPDFIVKDPKEAPVWEITGAEFTSADIHTANGISIRFPRITKFREDKDWETATNLQELMKQSRNIKDFLSQSVSPLKKVEELKRDLPDFFSGIKVLLPDDLDNREQLHRYLVAYNAEVVKVDVISQATHAIATSSKQKMELEKKNQKLKIVTADWLCACIKKQRLVSEKPYQKGSWT